MKMRKNEVITCPHCGREYLPAEIFVPRSFFGSPYEIERDYEGKILDFMGKNLDCKESYVCEQCDKTFYINTQIKFNTDIEDNNQFSEEYSISLKKPALFLDE